MNKVYIVVYKYYTWLQNDAIEEIHSVYQNRSMAQNKVDELISKSKKDGDNLHSYIVEMEVI